MEHASYISASHVDMDQDQDQNQNDGVYLSSTTEFFPIDDQEEQVYLDRYSDGKVWGMAFFFPVHIQGTNGQRLLCIFFSIS